MASYALLQAFSGFRYSAASKTLWFAPKVPGNFRTFFSTASAWGSIELNPGRLTISVFEGNLEIRHLHLTAGQEQISVGWEATVRKNKAVYFQFADKWWV
jgi:hypothetical protein